MVGIQGFRLGSDSRIQGFKSGSGGRDTRI